MPEIPWNGDIHSDGIRPSSADFSDMLIYVKKPDKERDKELTPQQIRAREFHESAGTGSPNYANDPGPRMSISSREVCRFGGSPPRHTHVAPNCPHGMNELLAEMKADQDAVPE